MKTRVLKCFKDPRWNTRLFLLPPVYPGVTGAHLQGRLPNDTPVQLLDVGGNGRVNTANGDPLIPVYLGGCVFSPVAVLASRKNT